MNTPNKISIFRIVLVPIITLVWLFNYASFSIEMPTYYIAYVPISLRNIICLAIFVIACISDLLDGIIARKTNQITTFGKFIDPIADKVLTTTMFILFSISGIIPLTPVIIMIWRDIIVDGARLVAAANNKIIAANGWGKAKTVVQMICIILVLANNLPFELLNLPVTDFMLWFSMMLSVISGITYINSIKKEIFK